MHLDFTPTGWGRVIAWTVFGTLLCVGVALGVDSFNFADFTAAERLRAILTDVLLPMALAAPLLLFFTNKLRQLAIAQRRLEVYASTDGLTGILNRAAFTTLVDAYLNDVRRAEQATHGALLILDADNFKVINDRFGHDRGDEALKLIAATLRDNLRSPDLLGRLGGEEFGVFLPGADSPHAETVAERLRGAIGDVPFVPAGGAHRLSVSIGGVVFNRRVQFDDLFRLADQQLYAAKHAGRDRSVVTPIARYGPVPLAAA